MKKSSVLASVFVLGLTAAACASDGSGNIVVVEASDTECNSPLTEFDAGKTTFEVKNNGSKVTEMYVYGKGDSVVSEVENIGPGTTRKLTVDLKAGEYELACKPGQTGDGIRTKITVTGAGGSQGGDQKEASREFRLQGVEYAFQGMDGFTAKAGETIEFYLENKGTIDHEFEVLGPDGKAIGEVEPVKAGATGEAKITMGKAGAYTYVCGIAGHEDQGMKGSFTVSE